MVFFLNKNLVFIDSMQFMNSSLLEYMNSFERFNEKNYLLENIFIALQKMEKLVTMVKYQTIT